MKNRADYAYAVGRVRALETRLISPEVFRNIIEADALTGALNVLSEVAHEEEIKKIRNSQDLELFLNERARRSRKIVAQLLDDEPLCSALFSLPENLDAAEVKINKLKFEFLGNLLRHTAKLKELSDSLRLNLKDRIANFFPTDYGRVARLSSEANQKQREDSCLFFEKLKVGFMADFLAGAKYITFGPEPIISYYFAKLNEIRLLRWVILGKINQIPNKLLLALT
ncbi:MAG: V-type ATPase subunit [Candidatus Omnitrophica bacterium]|nr:V-type ATPase subunit [Candidatus Omnitrophota bacterium]